MMYENISIKQARSDLKYIKDTYGEPQDFCGGFCNNNVLDDIIFGKMSIKEAIIENINYYFTNGLEDENAGCSSSLRPDYSDKRIQRIMDRYYIDEI